MSKGISVTVGCNFKNPKSQYSFRERDFVNIYEGNDMEEIIKSHVCPDDDSNLVVFDNQGIIGRYAKVRTNTYLDTRYPVQSVFRRLQSSLNLNHSRGILNKKVYNSNLWYINRQANDAYFDAGVNYIAQMGVFGFHDASFKYIFPSDLSQKTERESQCYKKGAVENNKKMSFICGLRICPPV